MYRFGISVGSKRLAHRSVQHQAAILPIFVMVPIAAFVQQVPLDSNAAGKIFRKLMQKGNLQGNLLLVIDERGVVVIVVVLLDRKKVQP